MHVRYHGDITTKIGGANVVMSGCRHGAKVEMTWQQRMRLLEKNSLESSGHHVAIGKWENF